MSRSQKIKLRKVGDVLLDMEPLLYELTVDHELQLGELLHLINSWVQIHSPGAIEQYMDGSNPILHYGAKRGS